MFCDDVSGEYGLSHDNAIDINTPFNAFWNGQGIFHDVFEHYFEEENKYFMGDAAFNVGGEVAAMGHLAYYVNGLGIGSVRSLRAKYGYINKEDIISGTHNEIQEACSYGYTNYGNTLICKVPYQRSFNSYSLEGLISEHIYKLKELRVKTNESDEKGYAREYRKTVTPSKLTRLYRWGYKQAERLVPNSHQNADCCENFIKYWNKFCKEYEPKYIDNQFDKVVFSINKNKELIEWNCKFRLRYETNQWVNYRKVEDYILG